MCGKLTAFPICIYIHIFWLQARRKGVPPPAKKAKKDSGSVHAKESGSRPKKSLSLLPAMPLDILFEVKNGSPDGQPCSSLINFIRSPRISLPRTSSIFPEQAEFS